MLAFVFFSYAGGQISRAIGRTKPTMLIALALCLAGLMLLATIGRTTPILLCVVYMVLLGSGIGLVQPNITVAIQNAAARPDVGVATGCMLLFRAIGGAAGATGFRVPCRFRRLRGFRGCRHDHCRDDARSVAAFGELTA
jgi:predicted MFS family arabinose efflux permease